MPHKSILISLAAVMCALIVGAAALQARAQSAPTPAVSQPHQPQSVIGDGTPGSCTQAAFATAFNAGGSITFNCGAAPVTITLTSRYTVTVDTLIDGGTFEQINLSGGDAGTGPRNGVGFFAVPVGRSLTLQNMVLTHAGDTAIVNAGDLSLVSTRIDYARAASCGSLLSVGQLSDNLSLFAYNTVDGDGGGICIRGGTAHLMSDQIVGNVAGGVGGGLYNNGGIIDTYGTYLIGNWALRGAGVYNATSSHLMLLYGVPEYNVASLTDPNGAGGGVDNHGVLTMTGNIVQYNQAYKGAGIANDGVLRLEGSNVQSNATASSDPANNIGGAVLTSQPMVISNTAISENTSGDAAIYATAPVTLTGVTLSDNTALQGTSGFAAYAPVSIEFSTFYSNSLSALSPDRLLRRSRCAAASSPTALANLPLACRTSSRWVTTSATMMAAPAAWSLPPTSPMLIRCWTSWSLRAGMPVCANLYREVRRSMRAVSIVPRSISCSPRGRRAPHATSGPSKYPKPIQHRRPRQPLNRPLCPAVFTRRSISIPRTPIPVKP